MSSVVLVGGPASVRRQYERRLAPLGMEIVDHWDWDRSAAGRELVACDAVLLLTDMMAHSHSDRARLLASAAGVPAISGNRKWAWTCQLLKDHGLLSAAVPAEDPDLPDEIDPGEEKPHMAAPLLKTVPPPASPLPPNVVEAIQLLKAAAADHADLKSLDVHVEGGKAAVAFEVVIVSTGGLEL